MRHEVLVHGGPLRTMVPPASSAIGMLDRLVALWMVLQVRLKGSVQLRDGCCAIVATDIVASLAHGQVQHIIRDAVQWEQLVAWQVRKATVAPSAKMCTGVLRISEFATDAVEGKSASCSAGA